MRGAWLMAVLLVTFAGCLEGPAPAREEHDWYVSGSFTRAATDEQMGMLGQEVAARGGSLAIMESFPAQFQAHGLTRASCEEMRPIIVAQPFVASVGECRERTRSDAPEEPTSNPPGGTRAGAAPWR